jgi:hypothetical protein
MLFVCAMVGLSLDWRLRRPQRCALRAQMTVGLGWWSAKCDEENKEKGTGLKTWLDCRCGGGVPCTTILPRQPYSTDRNCTGNFPKNSSLASSSL